LLQSETMQDQAVVSPDGKWIAFVSTHEGNAEIYIAPFDPQVEILLESAKNITGHPGGDFRPAFSPDGTRIAFSSDRGHEIKAHPRFPFARRRTGDIWVMNVDGTNLSRLTEAESWDGSPEWSADGGTIYFYSSRNGHERIFKMDADGNGQEPISSQGINAVSPKILPNGNLIYISWIDGPSPGISHRPKQLGLGDPAKGAWPDYDVDLYQPDTHANGLIVFHGGPRPPADKNKGFRGDILVKNGPVEASIEGTQVGLYGVRRDFVASPDPSRPVLYFSAPTAEGPAIFTPWLFALLALPAAIFLLIILALFFLIKDRKKVAFWKYLLFAIGAGLVFAVVFGALVYFSAIALSPFWMLSLAMAFIGLVFLAIGALFVRQRSRRKAARDPRARLSALSVAAALVGAAGALYIAIASPNFINMSSDFYEYDYSSDTLTKLFHFGDDYWNNGAFSVVLDTRLSPDGKQLTFTTGLFRGIESHLGRIWSYDFATKKLERIVESGMNDGFGDFSADGKKTVFRSGRDGKFDIFLSENGEARNLTNDDHKDNFPTISPDGTKIAFSSDREGISNIEGLKAMDIFLMELGADGNWSAARKLTESKGQNAHAHFSTNGEWIVYTTEDYGISDEEPLVQSVIFAPQMYGEIVALRLSDLKHVRLTHNKWEDGTPIWIKGY
jgi:Tol biopolymer transport system component